MYMDDNEIIDLCRRGELPTPAYLIHLGLLEDNLRILESVQESSGARIILALKGFAMFSVFPRLRRVLHGTAASSVHEARLGLEEFGRELHCCCVAYTEEEISWLSRVATHVTINSLSQWDRFRPVATGPTNVASYGLRINPEYSEVATELYDPCRPGTRFGITAQELRGADLEGIEGLHFHALCEQDSGTLARTLEKVEQNFGDALQRVKWLNMGGGHHISRHDYDIDLLCNCVSRIRDAYDVRVYLEPGEAIALHTGFLITTVLDRFRSSDQEVAILDTSATAHMPDVLEMPYRPTILGAGNPGERPHTIQLGGLTCLAGDVIGEYSFDQDLTPGDRLVFTDMAHYTMVKNTTFNGVPLPVIADYNPETDRINVIRKFTYEDYRNRLS
jgi:carboxynorspermidine decarboxylase